MSQDWLSEQWELMAEQPWFRGDMNRKDAKKELVGILFLTSASRVVIGCHVLPSFTPASRPVPSRPVPGRP